MGMKAKLKTANTIQCMVNAVQSFLLADAYLTDVELVSEIANPHTRELSADKAEDPVGCNCGGCTSELD